MRSRNDSSARSTCGRMMRASSDSSAAVSSTASMTRRCHSTGAGVSDMFATGRGPKTQRTLRIEAEEHPSTGLQIGQPAGLRQCYAELEARLLLDDEDRRIGAVEQQALHLPGMAHGVRRQLSGVQLDARGLGA